MATVSENRKMAKFLMDVMFFYLLPVWTPTVLVAALWLCFYFLLAWHGLLYGSFLTLLTAAVTLYGLGQHYLIVHRDRFFVGSYTGFALLIGGCYFAYINDIVSTPTKLVAVTLGLAVGYSAWQVHRTRPQLAPKEMQVELTQKILDAAPSEGTDEENQELVDFSQRQQQQQLQPPGGESVRLAVVKDAFTGRVSVVKQRLVSADDSSFRASAYQTSSSSAALSSHGGGSGSGSGGSSSGRTVEAVVRLRSLGPRLCGHCLSDKRCVEILKGPGRSQRGGLGHSSHSGADAFDGSGHSGGGGGDGPRTAISIATHCNYCQTCVLDQDHHCPYLHTCIGRGNRRLFVLFQSLLCAACLLYFGCSRYVAYDTLCDPLLMPNVRPADVAWYSLATLWRVERCVWSQYAHYAMVQYLALGLSLYAGMVAYVQCVLVMKETTLQHLVKDRAPLLDAQRRAHMVDNFWRFVRTGQYTVVYPRSAAPAAATTAATSSSSSSEMTHRQANTTGGVRSMLSALSATSKATTSGDSGSSSAAASTSTSSAAATAAAAAGSAVGRLWQRLEQSHGDDASRRGGLDGDEDTDETPLLFYAAHEQSAGASSGHRQRNGSFTTAEPPPTSSAAGRKKPPKKQVSFASHNQYQSPPSTSPDATLLARKGHPSTAAVVTHMPPKPATGSALDLTDVDLEAPSTPLTHRRATTRDARDGGSGSGSDGEEDEDSDGEAGFEDDEDDDYDPEFVDSDLNGYLGSGRSLADEAELARLLDEQRAAARHQQHHDHSHSHGHGHGLGHGGSLRGDVESGRSSRSGSEKVAGGVEAVARQSPWQR